jgi:hypothetical protein
MIYIYNIQNMQNMQTWTCVAFVLIQHRNKDTRVLFHSGIGLGFNRGHQKQFAAPDIINSELNSAFGDSRQINTQSWRLVFCNIFSVIGQQEMCI